MDTPDFPSNSEVSKKGVSGDKEIRSVVSGGAVRRRKSLRKQFTETFVAGDARTALRFAVLDVLLPAARDTFVEVIHQGVDKFFNGDNPRRFRGIQAPPSGPYGHVQYNRYSSPSMAGPQRAMSRQARALHNFDELVLDDRSEAEEVINRLFDLVSQYESATVADLYELVGLAASHTDNRWGWTNLAGAGVTRVRGGYLLDLPEPRPLG